MEKQESVKVKTFFGLHRFLAEKRDSVDVKTFILLVFNDFLWFHNEKLLTFL